ncbi:MAG: Hsp70 family protein [Planctomycetota bacterium]|nr:Hsp70 family protein [Planctomycetota bacterium]
MLSGLLEAFQRNNIQVQHLMPEPTAAAFAYAVHQQHDDRTLLVYDFGGGTLDVTVARTDGDEIRVLATDGVRQLGGNDLNRCLEKRLLDELEAKCGQRPTPEDDPLFAYDLRQRVEQAKISLATREQVPVVLAYDGTQLICEITQDEFHGLIRPLVDQSLESLDRAVAGAGLTIDKVDHLILVGGTSRLPYIQDAVAQHTSLAPKTDIDPEKAIAYGAALASLSELDRQGRHATIRGQVIPAPKMFVRDVTAHHVGCCVVDTSTSARRLSNSVIIPRNTPIPCRKTDRFFLEHADQPQARIEILQGDPNADRDDCLLIGELLLDDLPEEDRATARIQVEFVIDGNGMASATATDLVSNKHQTVSVDYKKGIKASEKPAAA